MIHIIRTNTTTDEELRQQHSYPEIINADLIFRQLEDNKIVIVKSRVFEPGAIISGIQLKGLIFDICMQKIQSQVRQ